MPILLYVTELRALADDPVEGWKKTPVASQIGQGLLAGPYLSAFLAHHVMPATRRGKARRLLITHDTKIKRFIYHHN